MMRFLVPCFGISWNESQTFWPTEQPKELTKIIMLSEKRSTENMPSGLGGTECKENSRWLFLPQRGNILVAPRFNAGYKKRKRI